MDNSKGPKYFCRSCKTIKGPKLVPSIESGTNGKNELVEVSTIFHSDILDASTGKKVHQEYKMRKLDCDHYVRYSTPAFLDIDSDNLSEWETATIRREIDKSMIGKDKSSYEQQVLFHCAEYNTLLKIAAKQKQQAKYAILYLDQLRERYAKQLNEKEKQEFEMKFAHFLDLKPQAANKVIERERTRTEKAADNQKSAVDQMKALLAKTGYKLEDLFKDKKEGE